MNFSWFAPRLVTTHAKHKREISISESVVSPTFCFKSTKLRSQTNRDNAYILGPPNSSPSVPCLLSPSVANILRPSKLRWCFYSRKPRMNTSSVHRAQTSRGVFSLRHSQQRDASPETGKHFQTDAMVQSTFFTTDNQPSNI